MRKILKLLIIRMTLFNPIEVLSGQERRRLRRANIIS